MSKRVRVGIVGSGTIGRVHAEAIQQCEGVQIAAVSDVELGRAKTLAADFEVPHALTDYRKLVGEESVDAVLVCSPNNTHLPVVLAAIDAGKDVLCEKPLAMNAREARRMVEAAQKADRILMAGQSSRYTAPAIFMKKLAESGRFGDIYYGKGLWLRRTGIPRGWFQDAKQSAGGPLIDLGVHAIDLLWWLMDNPKPAAAYGVTFDHLGSTGQGMGGWGVNYSPSKFSVEDMVGAIVRFEDGRALGIDISWAAHTGDLYWLRFFGTKGGGQIQPEPMIYQTDGETKLDTVPQLNQQNPYVNEDQHFVDCIRKRQEPISSGSQAVVIAQILDAISKSARTGRMVSIRTT